MRFASKMALRSPFNYRDPLYIPYTTRMNMLKILTSEERNTIAAIIFVIKCTKGEILSPIANQIRERRIRTVQRTRNPNLYQTFGTTYGSLIRKLINLTNAHRSAFNINDSTNTIRKELKAFVIGARIT